MCHTIQIRTKENTLTLTLSHTHTHGHNKTHRCACAKRVPQCSLAHFNSLVAHSDTRPAHIIHVAPDKQKQTTDDVDACAVKEEQRQGEQGDTKQEALPLLSCEFWGSPFHKCPTVVLLLFLCICLDANGTRLCSTVWCMRAQLRHVFPSRLGEHGKHFV